MRLVFFNICLLFGVALWHSSIYSIHITTIDGHNKSMGDFYNKKLLIIIIPSSKTSADSSFLRTIDTLSRNYASKIAVLAVPSVEDGYSSGNLEDLASYYHSILGEQVTIAQGMYTRKNSGNQQHELFSWLTHIDKNGQFDSDVKGPGQKFFISSHGELYGESEPQGKLNDRLMNRMIQMNQ